MRAREICAAISHGYPITPNYILPDPRTSTEPERGPLCGALGNLNRNPQCHKPKHLKPQSPKRTPNLKTTNLKTPNRSPTKNSAEDPAVSREAGIQSEEDDPRCPVGLGLLGRNPLSCRPRLEVTIRPWKRTPRVQVPNNHILSKILTCTTTILKPST